MFRGENVEHRQGKGRESGVIPGGRFGRLPNRTPLGNETISGGSRKTARCQTTIFRYRQPFAIVSEDDVDDGQRFIFLGFRFRFLGDCLGFFGDFLFDVGKPGGRVYADYIIE